MSPSAALFDVALCIGTMIVAARAQLPFCDTSARRTLASCATQMSRFGVFDGAAAGANALALHQLTRASKDYLLQLCNSYGLFVECLGPSLMNIKEACWTQEPVKGQFAVADAALQYLCGEGLTDMLQYWQCYIDALNDSEMTLCDAQMAADTRSASVAADPQLDGSACFTLQRYAECMSDAVRRRCGDEAVAVAVESLQRPVRTYLPFCTLSATCTHASTVTVLASCFVSIYLCLSR